MNYKLGLDMGATSTDNLADLPINIAANVAAGTAFGGGLYGGAKLLGYGASLFRSNAKRGMDYLRSKLGDKAVNAMIKEAEEQGRSLAEVADEKALRATQMARQNTEEAADIVSGNARKIEESSGDKSRALIDETLGNRGGFETVQELQEQAKKEAAPLWEKLNNKGDLARVEQIKAYPAESSFNPNNNYTRADAMTALEKRANNLGRELYNDAEYLSDNINAADNISISGRVMDSTNGGYVAPYPKPNNNITRLSDYVKDNDLIQHEIGKIRKDATLSREVREAADTDFRVLQTVKENIDDQISVAKRQGEDKLVRRLVEQKNELLNRMDEVVPEYKQARQIYEDEKQFERAVNLAQDVFDTKISAPKFAADARGLTRNEQQALKLGLRDEMYRIIGNAQNEALGWKRVVPANVQAKIRNVLGQTEGNKLINWANREITRMRNFNKLLQGSQTAEKTALQRAKDFWLKPVESASSYLNKGRNIGIADITTRPSANLARETFNQLTAPQGLETIYQALYNPRGVTALNSAMAAYLANAGLK
ncbi:MAG: hypothetical protein IJ184_05710 [Alphaproteobacteria bacterium]|nr:hypothetical protein [Alphaproteobacteria bacterium]